MTFSQNCKKEICSSPQNSCCVLASFYAILLFGNTFTDKEIKIITENEGVAEYIKNISATLFGFYPEIAKKEISIGQIYKIKFTGKEKIKHIISQLGITDLGVSLRIDNTVLENECCKSAFLGGVFLVCGSVTNPSKGYHLEFETPHFQLSKDLADILYSYDLPPKLAVRKSNLVLYYKESENIEDILNIIGASKSAFEIMNVKIIKEIRNNANRLANCETANITKTVSASSDQIECIKKLIKRKDFNELPESLKEIAKIRLKNPYMPLSEIGKKLKRPLSKSGVSHRLKKIKELCEKK